MAGSAITQRFAADVASVSFSSAADVRAFFTERTGQGFAAWFDSKIGGRRHWAERKRFAPGGAAAFERVWDGMPRVMGRPFNLFSFLGLTSAIMNETGGLFTPISEAVNKPTSRPPGIAYLFNAIPKKKGSYNKADNKLAGDLFHSDIFIAAHGDLALGDVLRKTKQRALWNGTTYPIGAFPTSEKLEETGFILQADLYKFRGRGLIQTTWRRAYQDVAKWIKAYTGPDPVIGRFARAWGGSTLDRIATESRTADWDALFLQTDFEVALQAVRLHSDARGDYLAMANTAAVLNGEGKGSIFRMGFRLNGRVYGTLFYNRVVQMCDALGNGS